MKLCSSTRALAPELCASDPMFVENQGSASPSHLSRAPPPASTSISTTTNSKLSSKHLSCEGSCIFSELVSVRSGMGTKRKPEGAERLARMVRDLEEEAK